MTLFNTLFDRFKKDNAEPELTFETPQKSMPSVDPLDPLNRPENKGWVPGKPLKIVGRTVKDFPIYEASEDKLTLLNNTSFAADAAIAKFVVEDSAEGKSFAMDDGQGSPAFSAGTQTVPEGVADWYLSQGFIGYQACAIIAQHWLVDKACSMIGEDAIRNGWTIKAKDKADRKNSITGEIIKSDNQLTEEQKGTLTGLDIEFKVKETLIEFNRFKNVFGIRVMLFEIESDDPKYYEKPFNIDGVTEDSYKGISQIDPYWMTPMLTTQSTSDPSSMHFYEPEYWIISGKRYHRSHLIIARGPQPADILKPTYIFGGIPLVQRIYERVYAAERTANEAPLLAMSKRTTALHVDLTKAAANEVSFTARLMRWIKWRDNHAVKVLGKDEVMEQFDTSLADFDSVVMNQYQIVAAQSKTPATKLLGTSPKGFNATGEFETVSYHEELESTQEHVYLPALDRHYLLLAKSKGIEVDIEVVFEPVDSVTAVQRAELNDKKADTAQKYITMGAVSPDEVRGNLRDDRHSGYNRLTDTEANEDPGMSPENIAALEKGEGAEEKGNAAIASPGAAPALPAPTPPNPAETDTLEAGQGIQPVAKPTTAPVEKPATVDPMSEMVKNTVLLAALLDKLTDKLLPEGGNVEPGEGTGTVRTSKPGTKRGVEPTVAGIRSVTPSEDAYKLPKVKVQGLVCSIENPRGTIRKGMDINGKQWASKMPNHYGFIKGTTGADGEEVDCFLGPNLAAPMVYVMNQKDPASGGFDEHKAMIGFNSMDEARNAYLAAYSSGWQGAGDMCEMTMQDFQTWLQTGDATQPLSANNLAQAGSAPETA